MDDKAKADAFDKIKVLLDVPEGEVVDAIKSHLDYMDTLESQLEEAEFRALQMAGENDRLQSVVRKLSPDLEDSD